MCGRFALSKSDRIDWAQFGVRRGPMLPPHWNLGPGRPIAAVRAEAARADRDEGAEFAMLGWGLVPFWAKDPAIGHRLANARAESVTEKPAFREAFRRRRCLIPADGFYEWQVVPGLARKQPWFIRRRDEAVFALAGMWERWTPTTGTGTGIEGAKGTGTGTGPVETCAVLTMEPNALMAPIHSRMPVIVAPAGYAEWLDASTPATRVHALLAAWAPDDWVAHRVSTRVNAVAHDDAACAAPVDGDPLT